SGFAKVAGILSRAVKVANCTARLKKNMSGATKRASTRSRATLSKAASISPIVAALRIIWICSPIACAASGMSRSVLSVDGILAGLTSTAIRTAFGTKSCRSRNRLAASSELKKLMPVALPPGRARLATRPSRIGSAGTLKTIGIVAVLDRYVLAFDVAGLVEAFAERGHIASGGIGRKASNKPDHGHYRLLRARCDRPHGCRAAEQADELPSPHAGHGLPPRCRRLS